MPAVEVVGPVTNVLYDENGNPVAVVLDGAVYRLQTSSKLETGDNIAGRFKLTDGTDVADINPSGQVAIQDQPNMDVALSTRATEVTAAGIKTHTDYIPSDPAREGGNLATLAGVDFATETTLASIKDIDGIKKITEQLPSGINEIGKIAQGTKSSGSNAWPTVLYDSSGNAISVVLDGAIYRLQTQSDAWLHDGLGNVITSEVSNSSRRLHVQTNFETNSGQIDAFARLRVSNPTTVFDSKRVSDQHIPLFWNTATVGGGTVTLQTQYARHRLSVAGGATDEAVVQTKACFIYQPGKSLMYMMTFNAQGAVANVAKRIGSFDDNNGVFLELYDTTVNFVKRSNVSGSPVDTKVAQASWNMDSLDGNGHSGITLDWTKVQIMVIDMEWLGAGSIRFGFIIDGQIYYAHSFHHSNIETVVHMRTPNQPIRAEIKALASSSAADFDAICQMVAVEGSNEPSYIIRSADRGLTALSTDDTLRPLISMRLKYTNSAIIPVRASCIAASASSFRQVLLLNPTITGGTAASWTQSSNSIIEYDISRDGVVSGGIQIDTTYASFKSDVSIADQFSSMHYLGIGLDGTADELVLAVQNIDNPTEQYLGAFTWKEQV